VATTGPLVSAILPLWNAEKFLVPALESLLEQDYESYEIVVCDDGSTDRTAEIISSYPMLRVVRQPNRGPAAARNAAIRESNGTFLAMFDGDDLWPRNRLRLQAAYLTDHPDVGCVLGRQQWMNPPPWLGRDPVYGDLDGIPILSAMFTRSALDRVGGFDETFGHSEDLDLLIRLRELGIRIEILPDVLLFRRFHEDQVTASPPDVPPLLRSLRQKLQRERSTGGDQ